MTLFEELRERGLVAQYTNEDEVRKLIDGDKPCTFYIGFDPTADSLHVGHYVAIMIMAHMQKHGHKPIALFGGGTGMIGDPSGKTDMRKMLSKETINHNIECFKNQMSRLIDFSDDKAYVVNNGDWLLNLNYVDFLREVGVHFSVNAMLTAECYKQRMERGLSFFELNYMIMQSYDFLVLNRKYDCILQLGGDDQWSNMLGGVKLCRRCDGKDVYAMTCNLLLTSEGKKMGKTEGGAVWLDANKTSPYEFYQYWRNVADADVIKCLKMLTFVPLEQIATYENLEGQELNLVKELLAFELTKTIHGEEEAIAAQKTARSLFGGTSDISEMPTTTLSADDFADGSLTILDLMLKAELIPSKGEGRRLVQQGGVSVDDKKITDPTTSFTFDALSGGIIIKKGKKVYHRIVSE